MKRQIIIGALLAATLAGGAWAGPSPDERPSPEGRLARMTRVLGLNDSQQSQIKAIFAAEREKSAPLMEKLAGYRKQLRDATQATTFDEAAVRGIATNQAQVEVELTVSRARVQNQINALLTADQRALEEKLHPPMGPGPVRPSRPGCEQ
jgi:Spy/CpxP family protein refolding chaperone